MSRQLVRQIVEQLSGRPALLVPRYAGASQGFGAGEVPSAGLLGDLREIAVMAVLPEVEQKRQEASRRRDLLAAYGYANATQDKPFAFSEGRAIIPVHGLLINRCSWSFGFLTGYNFIRGQVEAAIADADVEGIIYDVNSNGGTVAGCQETADLIWRASAGQGGKPSLAVVDANCFSAAYYLMSGADRIAVTPTGGVGSIGVLVMHLDVSAALDKSGLKVTFIHAGKHKVDANPYEPLSAEVAADLQSEIDKMYDRFVATVARNRPALSEAAVRDTEARCYLADDALGVGLVDVVATPPEAMEGYFDARGDDGAEEEPTDEPQQEGTSDMATETKPATAAAAAQPAAAAAAPDPAALAEQAAAARTAERERVKGIQTHAEAEGRTELAAHLALSTDLSVDAAAGILKASPKAGTKPAVAAGEPNHFQAAMNNGTNPNVGAGGEAASGSGGTAKPSRAAQILDAQRRLMGTKPAAA